MTVFDATAVGRLLFIAWLFAPAVVAVIVMAVLERRPPAMRVHRFWCGTAGRDVQLTVVGTTVRSCTAFEPAEAITCGRGCLHGGALRSAPAA